MASNICVQICTVQWFVPNGDVHVVSLGKNGGNGQRMI